MGAGRLATMEGQPAYDSGGVPNDFKLSLGDRPTSLSSPGPIARTASHCYPFATYSSASLVLYVLQNLCLYRNVDHHHYHRGPAHHG